MNHQPSVFPLSRIAAYLVVIWLGSVAAAYSATTYDDPTGKFSIDAQQPVPSNTTPPTYNDPTGKFTIDAPESWNLMPKTDENVYIFKRSGPEQFIVGYLPGTWDAAGIFSQAAELMKSNMADASPEGEVLDLQVNGNPARWGVYRGKVNRVSLTCMVGGVALKEGGVEFIAFLNEGVRRKWETDLRKAFQSIRNARAPLTGVRNAVPVKSAEVAKKNEPAQPSPSQPKIRVMDPPFKPDESLLEVAASPLTIRGAAMDDRGIQGVEINGQQATMKPSGDLRSVEFTFTGVVLQEGLNRVSVVATNIEKQKTELVLPLWLRKPAAASGPSARKGLTETEITDLLKNSVRPRRVEDLARDRGIAFDITPEVEERLHQAGADDALVQTLRDLSSKRTR